MISATKHADNDLHRLASEAPACIRLSRPCLCARDGLMAWGGARAGRHRRRKPGPQRRIGKLKMGVMKWADAISSPRPARGRNPTQYRSADWGRVHFRWAFGGKLTGRRHGAKVFHRAVRQAASLRNDGVASMRECRKRRSPVNVALPKALVRGSRTETGRGMTCWLCHSGGSRLPIHTRLLLILAIEAAFAPSATRGKHITPWRRSPMLSISAICTGRQTRARPKAPSAAESLSKSGIRLAASLMACHRREIRLM